MKKCMAAEYVRLSNEDGDKYESNSIVSQKNIIEQFVSQREDIEIVASFVDDGYTGTNFDRPDVKKMFKAIEEGKINTVIVKDLSRFGRNYIDVGMYLERYFPMYNVRFIAVNDGYDSNCTNDNDSLMMPLKNLFNAHYSKDISTKVKSAFKAKQTKGEFVGAFASYGYKKAENKNKLIIDPEAAIVVKRIFSMYNAGYGKISIAKKLNEEGIPCPSEYKKMKGENYRNAKRYNTTNYWTYATIHRMLSNPMYIGSMCQGRSIRRTVRGKATAVDKENWIMVENTHEAIIDKATWEATQELLKKRGRQMDFESQIGLFSGYIICGDCHRKFSKIRRGDKTYYVCGSYKRYSKTICSNHEVKEEFLETLILEKLNEEITKLDSFDIPEEKSNKLKADITPYKIRLEKLYTLKKEIYEDYKAGILEKEEYLAYKQDYNKEEELLKGQMNTLTEQAENNQEKNDWIESLKKYRRLTKLDRKTLACVLDSITVYETEDEKIIDIKLKYSL